MQASPLQFFCSCLTDIIRSSRLKTGSPAVTNGCSPKEKQKSKKPLLSKLTSSLAQAGCLWLPERCTKYTEHTLCSSVFLSQTCLSQSNVAHYPLHPFMQASSGHRAFCPASTLGMLLAVPGLCSFHIIPQTAFSSSFLKTWVC